MKAAATGNIEFILTSHGTGNVVINDDIID